MNSMSRLHTNHLSSLLKPAARLAAPIVALLVCLAAPAARADDAQARLAPDLPAPACDSVQVPDLNRVSLHVYALGVQVYRWDGSKWVFSAPAAALFADPCYEEQVGIHYAGPTWEANDGSKSVRIERTAQ